MSARQLPVTGRANPWLLAVLCATLLAASTQLFGQDDTASGSANTEQTDDTTVAETALSEPETALSDPESALSESETALSESETALSDPKTTLSDAPTETMSESDQESATPTEAMAQDEAPLQEETSMADPEADSEAAENPGVSAEFNGDETTEPATTEPTDSAADSTDAPALAKATKPEGSISDEIEDLKQELLELNRDLFILEEELLYPANSQLALYLSMDVGEFFQLDSVKVQLDDKLIVSELYTDHQVDALFRGGVQRLYLGNLKTGEHTLTAFFIGIGPNEREYKRAAEIVIDKGTSGKVYELKIKDSTAKLQPVFEIKEWLL